MISAIRFAFSDLEVVPSGADKGRGARRRVEANHADKEAATTGRKSKTETSSAEPGAVSRAWRSSPAPRPHARARAWPRRAWRAAACAGETSVGAHGAYHLGRTATRWRNSAWSAKVASRTWTTTARRGSRPSTARPTSGRRSPELEGPRRRYAGPKRLWSAAALDMPLLNPNVLLLPAALAAALLLLLRCCCSALLLLRPPAYAGLARPSACGSAGAPEMPF
jgi:hypothetical protein